MPAVTKKPIDIATENVTEVKVNVKRLKKDVSWLKDDVKELKELIMKLNTNIEEQNEVSKQGWLWWI